MLIDFTVENYRSIKEPVTLSAIAAKKSGRKSSGKRRPGVVPDDEIAPPYVVEGRGFELLPVLGIFGANASGKTNVLRALDELLLCMAYGIESNPFAIQSFVPYLFADSTKNSPCKFEVRILVNGNIYTYSLEIWRSTVFSERLEYVPSDAPTLRSRTIFDRKWDRDKDDFVWRNGQIMHGFQRMQRTLRVTEPFFPLISARFRVQELDALYTWLLARWPFLASDKHEEFAKKRLSEAIPDYLPDVIRLIRNFDTGVDGLQIVKSSTVPTVNTDHEYTIIAEHKLNEASIWMPFMEESAGTQHLFTLSTRIVAALREGTLMLVDELEASLHPNITREIVNLFQDPDTNPKRSQLVFTSHDNTLLDHNLLRRDQVWFTDKNREGGTDLFSLSDFKPRNDLALDKAYLDGRFGAVPFLPHHDFLLRDLEAA